MELQPARPGHRCVYIDQIPKLCSPLSPWPGKVCGKGIEVHCSGKRIVWGADPLCTGQRAGSIFRGRGQAWDEGCLGEAEWEGRGHGGMLHHCPTLPDKLSEYRLMPSSRITRRRTCAVTLYFIKSIFRLLFVCSCFQSVCFSSVTFDSMDAELTRWWRAGYVGSRLSWQTDHPAYFPAFFSMAKR